MRAAILILVVTALAVPMAFAGPEGGDVVAGDALIDERGGGRTDIAQNSNRAVIEWRRFDVTSLEHVHFAQPSTDATTLNRILGGSPSRIDGRVTAPGRLFFVNPDGIVFGPDFRIDVGALVATTAGITNRDFMAGRYRFERRGSPTAGIVNLGEITVAEQGIGALVAPWVRNDGVIRARLGRIALAGADTFTLDLRGDSLLSVAAEPGILSEMVDADGERVRASVVNEGTLAADGGTVYLTAATASRALDGAIHMGGVVQARTIERRGGEILLGGGDGDVEVTGRIDASGRNPGETGGRVTVLGDRIRLRGEATLDASGAMGGGEIRVGGDFQGGGELPHANETAVEREVRIFADATDDGDGGLVVLWSGGGTEFAGSISSRGGARGGNGGQVEVSGLAYLEFRGSVSTLAPAGRIGDLLLDPTDVWVNTHSVDPDDAGRFHDPSRIDEFTDPDDLLLPDATTNPRRFIDYFAIVQSMANVTIRATNDIHFPYEAVMQGPGVGLTLEAGRHVYFDDLIQTQGGDIHLVADADGNGTGALVFNKFNSGTQFLSGGGDITLEGTLTGVNARFDAGGGNVTILGSYDPDAWASVWGDPAGTSAPRYLHVGRVSTLRVRGDIRLISDSPYHGEMTFEDVDRIDIDGTLEASYAIDVRNLRSWMRGTFITAQGPLIGGPDSFIRIQSAQGGQLRGTYVTQSLEANGVSLVDMDVDISQILVIGSAPGGATGVIRGTVGCGDIAPGIEQRFYDGCTGTGPTDGGGTGDEGDGGPQAVETGSDTLDDVKTTGVDPGERYDYDEAERRRKQWEADFNAYNEFIRTSDWHREYLKAWRQDLEKKIEEARAAEQRLSDWRSVAADRVIRNADLTKERFFDFAKGEVLGRLIEGAGENSALVEKLNTLKGYYDQGMTLKDDGVDSLLTDIVIGLNSPASFFWGMTDVMSAFGHTQIAAEEMREIDRGVDEAYQARLQLEQWLGHVQGLEQKFEADVASFQAQWDQVGDGSLAGQGQGLLDQYRQSATDIGALDGYRTDYRGVAISSTLSGQEYGTFVNIPYVRQVPPPTNR